MRSFRLWGLLLGGLLVSSCAGAHDDSYAFLSPKLPVTQAFAMDKAGNRASIDFWVVPGQNDLKHRYMVSLNFQRGNDKDLIDFFKKTKEPVTVKVKVFQVKNQTETRITAQDESDIRSSLGQSGYPAPSQEKTSNAYAYLSVYGWDSHTLNVLVAGFRLNAYGHYRADIETVQDQPIFKGVKSDVKIEDFYNTGE